MDEAVRDIAMRAEAKADKNSETMVAVLTAVGDLKTNVALMGAQLGHMQETASKLGSAFEKHTEQNTVDHKMVVDMYHQGNQRVHERMDVLVTDTAKSFSEMKDAMHTTLSAVMTASAEQIKTEREARQNQTIEVLKWIVGGAVILIGTLLGYIWMTSVHTTTP